MGSQVLIVFGLPGSGKSYFASRLADRLQAEYLSSDSIRHEMDPERTYSKEEKYRIYDIMMERMAAAIHDGRPVVVDATFFQDELRRKFQHVAEEQGAPATFIEIVSDEEIIRERVGRKRQFSDADYDVYLKIRDQFEAMEESHLVLSSGRDNIDDMLRQAMEYLRRNEE